MSKEPTDTRRKPGRRSETPQEKHERLLREAEAAGKAAKADRDRMLALVSDALLAEAKASPEFMNQVREILARRATTKALKEAGARLLGIAIDVVETASAAPVLAGGTTVNSSAATPGRSEDAAAA